MNAARLVDPSFFDFQAMLTSAELSNNTTYVIYLVYKLNTTTYFDWKEGTCILDSLPMTTVELCESNSSPDNNYCCLVSVEDIHQACETEEEMEIINTYLPSEITSRDGETVYYPKKRQDGHWMEVALGEFFNGNEKDTILVHLTAFDTSHIDTLLIEGIEFRAKIL